MGLGSIGKAIKKVGAKAGPKAIVSHVKTLGQKTVQVAVPLASASLSYSTLGLSQHYTDSKIKKSKTLGGGTRFAKLSSKTTSDYNAVARPIVAGLAVGGVAAYAGGGLAPLASRLAGVGNDALTPDMAPVVPGHGATSYAGAGETNPLIFVAAGVAVLAGIYFFWRK